MPKTTTTVITSYSIHYTKLYEIADGLATLADALAVLREADPTSSEYGEALQVYGAHLKNITTGASLVGLVALGEASANVERNLHELATDNTTRRTALCELLQQSYNFV